MRKWFRQLKVSHKLMLITIFFVMPDSLMLYFFITDINANIHFARMEEKGNEYQRPLEDLLELIPQHRFLAQRDERDEQFQAALSKQQAQIDAALTVLAAIDARVGDDLQFTDEGLAKRKRGHCRVRTVGKEWEELKTGLAQLTPEECAKQHLHLMADVRTMITHAGDLSNLILDPDLDSYYLMDVTLLALPQTQDRLASMLAEGETLLNHNTLSSADRQRFAIHAAWLKEADLDRISASLQTALNEDPNFYGTSATLQARMPEALKEYTDATKALVDMTRQLGNSETFNCNAAEFIAVGNKARDASFKLWKLADEELDVLLQKRIAFYHLKRAKSLALAACALVAGIGFVTFITRSISGPLRKYAAELQTANQALQAEITERKRAADQLVHAQGELLEVSRLAGMAEVATGVLHNVGNVLNSVNVSVTLVADKVKKSRSASLTKVTAMLRDNEANLGAFMESDAKGKQLPNYVAALSESLEYERAWLLEEVGLLQKNVEHIKDIVAMQQAYGKVSGVSEVVKVSDLVEDAIRMNGCALDRHHVLAIREFEEVPPISIEKHKVLQILVNLIGNAKYACGESNSPDKKLTMRIVNGHDRVKIVVSDNGVGIPAENLTRIFNHGFTTRKDGHGFGLHSGVLAARELGGNLTVHSDGPGRGATFTVELPLAPTCKLQA